MKTGFVCNKCGYMSIEEVGREYYCPKCGNQMTVSHGGDMFGNGSNNIQNGVRAIDIFYFIFYVFIFLVVGNFIPATNYAFIILFIGIIIYVWTGIKVHNAFKEPITDKAIIKNNNGDD